MKNMKLVKKISIVAGVVTLAASLCACSSGATNMSTPSSAYDYKYAGEGAPQMNAEPAYDYDEYESDTYYEEIDYYSDDVNGIGDSSPLNETQAESSVAKNRKLIKTVDLSIETISFDETISKLREKIASVGGYIENEYTFNGSIYNNNRQNKYANITVRVPDDKLDVFVNDASGTGNVTQKTTSTKDVTLNYVDTESKKQMYLAQQESLLALMENAESIEEITYLTQELASVRYNIESMESTLRVYDDLVDYATVNININEVQVLTTPTVVEEKTPGQELKEGFVNSLNDVLVGTRNFFIRLVINLPYIIRGLICLAIPAVIIFVIVRIIIAVNRKKTKKGKEFLESIKDNNSESKKNEETKKDESKKEEPAKDSQNK